jgi:hypothetical protein
VIGAPVNKSVSVVADVPVKKSVLTLFLTITRAETRVVAVSLGSARSPRPSLNLRRGAIRGRKCKSTLKI